MEDGVDVQARQDEFEAFLTATQEARDLSARDRDYRDHKQWTDDEVRKLQARGQAPVVINRIKTKVNTLTGIQRQRRRDPKALPRTPKHEKDADSITDALRFVADNADFEHASSDVFEDIAVWGYAGAITEIERKTEEIRINPIMGDRLYFDPHSRRLDFKDAKYMGIVIWMDEADAKEQFGAKADDIAAMFDDAGETFEDKPLWIDRKRKRLRVCQHYYLKGGKWYECYFTYQLYLKPPKPSPYLDENGEPTNPIEAQAAYIDRDNNRYGEVRAYIWAQDEVNHRRSKALYNLSTRQTMGDKGVVDTDTMKQEMAKANGHVELLGGPNMRFEVLNNNDQTEGQLLLYQDAKADIDTVGANAALSGTQDKSLSGRALEALQQGGIAELGGLFDGHAYWEKRVYRQMWARIKQFWTGERWVRVTDNEDNLRWVGLNQPVTYGQALQEKAQQGDQRAQQILQIMLQTQDPRLNEQQGVKNNVAELDVDVILTQSVDYASIKQEQFQTMAELAKAYGPEAVPFEAMLRLSDMTNKEEVLDLLKPDKEADPAQVQAQQQLQAEVAQLEFRGRAAEVEKTEADVKATQAKAAKDFADAEAQALENLALQQRYTLIGGASGPA